MTSTISLPIETAVFPPRGHIEITDLTELVRGSEQSLLARLSPLVRNQDVTLDLGSVKRIDAAGIAALIALHTGAHEARHRFKVANLSPHVAEILSLVGLGEILLSHTAA